MTEKDKIKQYLDYKHYSKNSFYVKTGLSVGFLDSVRSLGVDKLRIIIDNYPDLNLTWLVTGEGAMIKEEIPKNEVKIIYRSDPKDVEIMQLQRDKIKFLEDRLRQRDIEGLDYAQIVGTPYTAKPHQKP